MLEVISYGVLFPEEASRFNKLLELFLSNRSYNLVDASEGYKFFINPITGVSFVVESSKIMIKHGDDSVLFNSENEDRYFFILSSEKSGISFKVFCKFYHVDFTDVENDSASYYISKFVKDGDFLTLTRDMTDFDNYMIPERTVGENPTLAFIRCIYPIEHFCFKSLEKYTTKSRFFTDPESPGCIWKVTSLVHNPESPVKEVYNYSQLVMFPSTYKGKTESLYISCRSLDTIQMKFNSEIHKEDDSMMKMVISNYRGTYERKFHVDSFNMIRYIHPSVLFASLSKIFS
jgi:hypothetical protein